VDITGLIIDFSHRIMKKLNPLPFEVPRGQTQTNVNQIILTYLYNLYPQDSTISFLDLPCGNLEFLESVKKIFPLASLTGTDLYAPAARDGIHFTQMDLTKDFALPAEQKFTIVSSISGVMMFSNTLSFIRNCSERIKIGGTFILTNDNNATIRDRLAYFFLGRFRIFNLVFEDKEPMTENVPIQELVRLMRTQGIRIDDIEYTSFYPIDVLFIPFALIAYLTQWLYLKRLKTQFPESLKWQMYPFKHLLGRHYIIRGTKLV
jgi:hypothetical protein